MKSNTFILRGIIKGKLCRKTAALPAADGACVNNNSEQDAADRRCRGRCKMCVSGIRG